MIKKVGGDRRYTRSKVIGIDVKSSPVRKRERGGDLNGPVRSRSLGKFLIS